MVGVVAGDSAVRIEEDDGGLVGAHLAVDVREGEGVDVEGEAEEERAGALLGDPEDGEQPGEGAWFGENAEIEVGGGAEFLAG